MSVVRWLVRARLAAETRTSHWARELDYSEIGQISISEQSSLTSSIATFSSNPAGRADSPRPWIRRSFRQVVARIAQGHLLAILARLQVPAAREPSSLG
jgi:hypothetical protein